MADRYWVGSTTSWNTSSNWASSSGGAGGAGVPTSADAAIFDGNGTGNMTPDVAISVASLDVQPGYSGTIYLADYSHASSGDVTFAGSGHLDMGNATFRVSGNYDHQNQATYTRGTSTVILDGTSKNLLFSSNKGFQNLTISGSYTATGLHAIGGYGNVIISGTFNANSKTIYHFNSADFTITGTGTVNNYRLAIGYAGHDFTMESGGSITYAAGHQFQAYGVVGLSGDFGNLEFQTKGTNDGLILNGDTKLKSITAAGTTTGWSVTTNNNNLIINGDVVVPTGGTWTKGTGTITLAPPAATTISVDFDGETIEDIIVDGAGTAELTGAFTTDSLTCTSGTLDVNLQNITVGDMTVAAGCSVIE
jgi:hypothetical protein